MFRLPENWGGVLTVAFVRSLVLLTSTVFSASLAFSQSSPADGPWFGSIQCQLDVQQSGFVRHETQTWTLTSSMPVSKNGDMQIYSAAWAATGQGMRQMAQGPRTMNAQWTINVPSTNAPIAIFIRAQDGKLIIRQWHQQQSLPSGVNGMRQVMMNSAPAGASPVNFAAMEWRLPWIETTPDSLSGTLSVPTENLAGDLGVGMQPSTAVCKWGFSRKLPAGNRDLRTNLAQSAIASAGSTAGGSAGNAPSSGAAAGGAAKPVDTSADSATGAQAAGNAPAAGSTAGGSDKPTDTSAGSAAGAQAAGNAPIAGSRAGGSDKPADTSADSTAATGEPASDAGASGPQTSSSAATAIASTGVAHLGTAGSGGAIHNITPTTPPTKTFDKLSSPGVQALASSVNLASSLSIKSTNPPILPSPRTGITMPYLISGGTASLQFQVSNGGPATVDGAIVSLPPVAGVTAQAVTCSLSTCPTIAELEKGWKVPQLVATATATFTIEASVSGKSGPLTLMAKATPPAGVTDLNPSDNDATLNATVVPLAADLGVTVTSRLPPNRAVSRFSYNVNVGNVAGLPADGALVTIPAVAGIQKVAVSCALPQSRYNQAACPNNPTVAQIEQGLAIPKLGAESGVTFTIEALATSSGNQTLSASVTPPSGLSDLIPTNNSGTAVVATTQGTPGNADVSVVVTPSSVPGRNSAFSVQVKNAGPDPAGLTVIKMIPAFSGATAELHGCTGTRNQLTGVTAECPFNLTLSGLATGLEIPYFPPGTSVFFDIWVIVTTRPATVTLSADATLPSGGTDPNPANNSASASVTLP